MAYRPKQLDKGRYRRSSSSDFLFKSSDIVVKNVVKFLTVFESCQIVIRNFLRKKKSKFCKTIDWWNNFASEPQLAWIVKLWVFVITISQLLKITISHDRNRNLQLFLQMFCLLLLQIFRFFSLWNILLGRCVYDNNVAKLIIITDQSFNDFLFMDWL